MTKELANESVNLSIVQVCESFSKEFGKFNLLREKLIHSQFCLKSNLREKSVRKNSTCFSLDYVKFTNTSTNWNRQTPTVKLKAKKAFRSRPENAPFCRHFITNCEPARYKWHLSKRASWNFHNPNPFSIMGKSKKTRWRTFEISGSQGKNYFCVWF